MAQWWSIRTANDLASHVSVIMGKHHPIRQPSPYPHSLNTNFFPKSPAINLATIRIWPGQSVYDGTSHTGRSESTRVDQARLCLA